MATESIPHDGTFPESWMRGLRKRDWSKGKAVKAAAFMPDDKTIALRGAAGRSPGAETSINWEDDESVRRLTLSDRANASHGAARVETKYLKIACELPLAQGGSFCWERDPIGDNEYHGNLVFGVDLEPGARNAIAGLLAAASEKLECEKR